MGIHSERERERERERDGERETRQYRFDPPDLLLLYPFQPITLQQVHRATLFVSGSAHPTPVAVLCAPRGSIAAEAEVLLKLGRHPHLVRFFGLCSDGDNELLVTELAPMGSIADIMQVKTPL